MTGAPIGPSLDAVTDTLRALDVGLATRGSERRHLDVALDRADAKIAESRLSANRRSGMPSVSRQKVAVHMVKGS
jgi:hypothetical protein